MMYNGIQELESGGDGGARVAQLEPLVKSLSEHVRASLTVPGENQGPSVAVKVLVDSGSGVTAIPEALFQRLEVNLTRIQVFCLFEGSARVADAFDTKQDITTKTCPLHWALRSPRGKVRITVSFVIFCLGLETLSFSRNIRCVTCGALIGWISSETLWKGMSCRTWRTWFRTIDSFLSSSFRSWSVLFVHVLHRGLLLYRFQTQLPSKLDSGIVGRWPARYGKKQHP